MRLVCFVSPLFAIAVRYYAELPLPVNREKDSMQNHRRLRARTRHSVGWLHAGTWRVVGRLEDGAWSGISTPGPLCVECSHLVADERRRKQAVQQRALASRIATAWPWRDPSSTTPAPFAAASPVTVPAPLLKRSPSAAFVPSPVGCGAARMPVAPCAEPPLLSHPATRPVAGHDRGHARRPCREQTMPVHGSRIIGGIEREAAGSRSVMRRRRARRRLCD